MLQAGLKSLGGNTLGKLANKLMGSTTNLDDEKDLEEESYGQQEVEETQSYEVSVEKQDKTESQFDTDAKEELETQEDPEEDDEEEEEEEQEEEEESEDVEVWNEEQLVNSALFAKEFESAIEHVSDIAKAHREEMLQSAQKQLEESGTLVTEEMMSKAMKTFAVLEEQSLDEESEEEEEDEIDEDELAMEMAEALEAVRELAQMHQPEFVDKICDLYEELNDEEPSTMELYGLFEGIKSQFVEEAEEMDSAVEDESEMDAETLAEEMDLALCQVRKQAFMDQEGLVDYICDYFVDFNGCEPGVDTICDIFGRIKEQLACDAREEFLDLNEDLSESEDDSDYGVSSDSAAEHYCSDCEDDVYIEGEDDVESESEIESEIDDDEAFDYLEEIEDEEELVNDPVFGAMWCSAIEHIQSIGKEDGVDMLWQIVEEFEGETGNEVTEDMVEAAVTIASCLDEVDSEDEEPENVEDLLAVAQDIGSALGSFHQEQLVNSICDLFVEENGVEPSLNKLFAIFGDVEEALAESEEEEESDVDSEEEEEEVDEDSFAAEWNSAMSHVEALAKSNQMEMVNTICDIYCELNGEEPSTPELYELFADIKASFSEEATEDLINKELEDYEYGDDEDDIEDEDYTVDSDPFYYGFDALDDVLFHDSAYDESDSADSYYVPEFELSAMLYEEDAECDVVSSTEEEADEEEEEEKAGEVDSDSEYSPDKESYFYFSDYQDELVEMSSSSSESTSASEYAGGDVYDPKFDMNTYSTESFESEDSNEEEEEDSSDESYMLEKDTFDYSQDLEDDFGDDTEEESNESAVEDELDSELAA